MPDVIRISKIKKGFTVSLWENGFADDESVYYAKDLAEVNNLLYQFFLLEKDDSKASVVNS